MSKTFKLPRMTEAEWRAQAQERFGRDPMKWRFVCPSCGHVAAVEDWHKAGAPEGAVAFSCIGRFTGDRATAADNAFKKAGGPCNYTSGGFIVVNELVIECEDSHVIPVFAVATAEVQPCAS